MMRYYYMMLMFAAKVEQVLGSLCMILVFYGYVVGKEIWVYVQNFIIIFRINVYPTYLVSIL